MAVRPHARAWIETSGSTSIRRTPKVRPHARAWIETGRGWGEVRRGQFALTRGRGLKLINRAQPPRDRWFALTRGRGLKRHKRVPHFLIKLFALTRGRGLKHSDSSIMWLPLEVRPHARAWIETRLNLRNEGRSRFALTRGRGLKQRVFARTRIIQVRPHARAWIETSGSTSIRRTPKVRPHARAWIETPTWRKRCRSSPSSPSREGVD